MKAVAKFECRPQVSGAISGLLLEEAAHRLVRNSLQIKANSAGLLDSPYNRKNSSSFLTAKMKPSRPSGYEGGFQNPNLYPHRHLHNPRDFSNPRVAHSTELQNTRNPFRSNEHFNPQDQYHIERGTSQSSVEDGLRYRPHQRMMPSSAISPIQPPPIHNVVLSPPLPPTNWIGKHLEQVYAPNAGGHMSSLYKNLSHHQLQQQQQSAQKVVYRIKSQSPET